MLERLFALDTRSLALFRLGIGLLVVIDAVGRWPDLVAHYADAGALPRDLALALREGPAISLHMAHGSAEFVAVLLGLQALAGLCVAAGYHTRLATAVAWGLVLSLQHRNPLVLNYGDIVLRLLLLWSIFLPLGERASLDRRRGPPRPPAVRFLGGGSAGFVVQIAVLYFFSGLLKTGPAWLDGSAVAEALRADHLTKQPQAALALGYPALLAQLTHAVRWVELLGPLLLFVPAGQPVLRTALIALFWSFHLGLFAFLELGLFAWVCIVGWSALLPGAVWDRLGVGAGDGPRLLRRRQWPAFAVLALVLASNLLTLREDAVLPGRLSGALRLGGLQQRWAMFAPEPARDRGWLVVVGNLADGRQRDLLRDRPVVWTPPAEASALYDGARWRTYLRNLWRRPAPGLRRAYARWLCRSVPGDGSPIESVAIHFVEPIEPTPDDPARWQSRRLWQETCAPR